MERSLSWDGSAVVAVDQRALPGAYQSIRLSTVDDLVAAIERLSIRGAPAIGVAAALGVALSARAHTRDGALDADAVRRDADRIAAARPTAVNLGWGVRRALSRVDGGAAAVLAEALAMLDEDERVNRAAAHRAAEFVRQRCPDRPLRLLTHCNTGGLATVAWGTALGAIRELAGAGLVEDVLVGETRPLLQGARLTAWELSAAGIPHRLCVDSAGPAAIATGLVDCVLVGADRVATNGDVANKVGTYSLACAAARAGIPFVVVAPESTIDPGLAAGAGIVIEQRAAAEVTQVAGHPVAPHGTAVYNPAFDVTPAELVTAVITELRVIEPSSIEPGHPDPQTAAGALVEVSRGLYLRGWMDGTAGNVSTRVTGSGAGDLALITASGRSKGELTGADTVLVDAASGAPAGPGARGGRSARKPSAETAIHAALYRLAGDCGAVVHAHPPSATVVSAQASRDGLDAVRFADFEIIKGFGLPRPAQVSVPLFENWPDVDRIADDVAGWLAAAGPDAPPVLLIAYHGATAWGPTLAAARDRLECLEALCRLHLLDAGQRAREMEGIR